MRPFGPATRTRPPGATLFVISPDVALGPWRSCAATCDTPMPRIAPCGSEAGFSLATSLSRSGAGCAGTGVVITREGGGDCSAGAAAVCPPGEVVFSDFGLTTISPDACACGGDGGRGGAAGALAGEAGREPRLVSSRSGG